MEKDRAADGLRGLAALSVVFCHLFITLFPLGFVNIYPGTSYPDATAHALDSLLSFPLLSIFWNGNFAVCVFFVLSGYVLTKAFVETGDPSTMKLRAARRYLRLGVPVFGSVLLSYFVLSMGWNHSLEASTITGSKWLTFFWRFDPSWSTAWREGSYGAILFGSSTYTPILWTMRVEFIGSMIVFAYRALALAGRAGWLTALTLTGVLVAFFPGEWMLYIGFVAGSYLGHLPTRQPRWLVWSALAVAVIGGGFDYSHWYAWTSNPLLSGNRLKCLMNTVGAVALLFAVRSGSFRTALLSRAAQFLGRISYAIYLVHFPAILTFTAWLIVRLRDWHYTLAAFVVIAATFGVVLPLAFAFELTFDRLGIFLSKRIFHDRSQRKYPEVFWGNAVQGVEAE